MREVVELVMLPRRKRAPQARRNPSDAVKSWRAAMRAKYGPDWWKNEELKKSKPVRTQGSEARSPKSALEAIGWGPPVGRVSPDFASEARHVSYETKAPKSAPAVRYWEGADPTYDVMLHLVDPETDEQVATVYRNSTLGIAKIVARTGEAKRRPIFKKHQRLVYMSDTEFNRLLGYLEGDYAIVTMRDNGAYRKRWR